MRAIQSAFVEGQREREREGGERVVREEECRNGAPGTIIVAEKAPEILELGRVL